MNWIRNHLRTLLISFILLLGVTGVFGSFRASRAEELTPRLQPLTSFTENDVAVEISLIKDPNGSTWLTGTFTPLLEHFHLYSKDLPKTGINGQGRPTLMEILNPSKVRPLGELIADQPINSHFNYALASALPVYPEGPVTLRLPVELPQNGKDNTRLELSVTYMACSQQTCLAPVIDKVLSLVIRQ
ncbi:MAG TPA: hypothetical protein VMT73_08100 [Anaerolineales bacterium]|nr:hypothetical protein [Anaerolineales bacterium]